MKKVKFMLMAIAIIAVVGGALAFKASEKYNLQYCTTTVEGDICPQFCPTLIVNASEGTQFHTKVCTTTPVEADPGNECYVDGVPANGPLECGDDDPIFITTE